MNWGCPHLEKERCGKLRKTCCPTQKGCVLHGKVKISARPFLEIRIAEGADLNVGRNEATLKKNKIKTTQRRKIK